MAVRFSVPRGPEIKVLNIEYFKGVDLYNAPANVEIYRSPEAPNMMRDEVGKVRKRMGFATVATFSERINGLFSFEGVRFVHAGAALYVEDAEAAAADGAPAGWRKLYSDMNDARSQAIPMKNQLFLLDGKTFLVYDGETVAPVSQKATVPTTVIGRAPNGGGEDYDPLNLISSAWTETFLGTETDKVYQLSANELDADPVLCEVMNADGDWVEKVEETDFTVDRATGQVTFKRAPGAPAVPSVDNIKLTAKKTRTGYADRINCMTFGTLYGVNGAPDRLFLAGHPEFPNLDHYSAFEDPTYFADTWYAALGQDDARVMGYFILNNQLAAVKSGGSDGRTVIIRNGELNEKADAVFPIVNTLNGEGAVSRFSFQNLGREPLFLTRLGVYAVTAEELTGEKYIQLRSLYLSSALQNEPDLSDAVAFVWRDFYLLSLNGKVYLLDGLQKEYQRNAPYSNYQYEAYFWTGVDARVFFSDDETLFFGTSDGRLCRFHNQVDDPNAYNDDGRPIDAYWDTPDLDGKLFYRNKTFRYAAVRLAAAIVTGIQLFVQKKGIWSKIFDAGERARYLDFNYVNFAKFTFSTDTTPRTLGHKIKVKKVDKARFRLKNNALNEPFGIYSFALEYTEAGRYKG